MNNIKKIMLFALDNLGGIVFGLFSTVFVARFYGPENMGHLSYVQAVASVLSFIFILGMDNVVMRDFIKDDNKRLVFVAVSFIRGIGGIFFIVSVTSWVYFFSDTPRELILPLILSACSAAYFGKSTIVRLFLQATENPKYLSLSTLLSRLVALAYILVVLHFKLNFYYAALYLFIYSAVSQVILLFAFFSINKKYNDNIYFKNVLLKCVYLFKESRFVLFSSILLPLFMYFDSIIIEEFLSAKDVGIYGAAVKLVTQVVFIGHIFVFSFFNKLNHEIDKNGLGGNVFRNIIRLMLIFGILGGVFTYFFGDYVISILYGNKYIESGIILKIVVWKLLFAYFGAFFSRVLIIQGWSNIELIKTIIASFVSLSCSVIFIQCYGLIAIAIVSVASYAIADLLSYLLFRNTRIFVYVVIEELWSLLTNPISSTKKTLFFVLNKPVKAVHGD
ncbi:oligosaccharide flippase family protein [Vibrio salinus]|uniref:oligosaccharide flippase family protein n=1 Tax=Vibrio salinus TaxID=2899784 RepID=UPI001E5ADD68|nr:oligosaccharide flippase family protein [Vibrio salinus]MCE0493306.1 oligosaccharide flippase family protein [Vibrio salinus]